jgi:hypothetical protein
MAFIFQMSSDVLKIPAFVPKNPCTVEHGVISPFLPRAELLDGVLYSLSSSLPRNRWQEWREMTSGKFSRSTRSIWELITMK